MPIYLNTIGNDTLAIGICARCSRKMPLGDLHPDPTYPGLLVCQEDLDEYDPYLLPPREPENIVLRNPRPDTPLETTSVAPGTPAWPVPDPNLASNS